ASVLRGFTGGFWIAQVAPHGGGRFQEIASEVIKPAQVIKVLSRWTPTCQLGGITEREITLLSFDLIHELLIVGHLELFECVELLLRVFVSIFEKLSRGPRIARRYFFGHRFGRCVVR